MYQLFTLHCDECNRPCRTWDAYFACLRRHRQDRIIANSKRFLRSLRKAKS